MCSFIRLSPFLTQYMMGTLDATSKLIKNRYEKVFFCFQRSHSVYGVWLKLTIDISSPFSHVFSKKNLSDEDGEKFSVVILC